MKEKYLETSGRLSLVSCIILVILSFPGSALAEVVPTDDMFSGKDVSEQGMKAPDSMVREDVRNHFMRMGVSAENADQRVAAMTDEEAKALAEGSEDLPAGASVGLGAAILIAIIVVLMLR